MITIPLSNNTTRLVARPQVSHGLVVTENDNEPMLSLQEWLSGLRGTTPTALLYVLFSDRTYIPKLHNSPVSELLESDLPLVPHIECMPLVGISMTFEGSLWYYVDSNYRDTVQHEDVIAFVAVESDS